ncbi:MAG: hypothetical protein CMQ05_02875 [Gammaproteobacteria bacterium]|nr:hypothetical protein [Gammaproteobacteria bacterium]
MARRAASIELLTCQQPMFLESRINDDKAKALALTSMRIQVPDVLAVELLNPFPEGGPLWTQQYTASAGRGAGYSPARLSTTAGLPARGFCHPGALVGCSHVVEAAEDIGIFLLLLTIVLRLNLKELLGPQLWAVTSLHRASVVPLFSLDTVAAWSPTLGPSLSSTVFAVKMFEGRGETSSFHATLTTGVRGSKTRQRHFLEYPFRLTSFLLK